MSNHVGHPARCGSHRAAGTGSARSCLAHQTWGAIPGTRYVHNNVVDFLTTTDQRWDTIYSIWGTLWFTDPQQLLPLIRARVIPGGRLVFSHAPAVPGSYGIQGIYGNGFTGRQVWIYRRAYEPDHVGTLIVEARARSGS